MIVIKILYILYFNAPMGGLHENVFNSAKYMKKNHHDVYVMVKPGPYAEKLNAININTITTDFENIEADIALLKSLQTNFDIIHFHPGKGRHVALKYAEIYNIPLIYTVHGKWHGQLNQFIDKLDAVITVSEGVSDYIKSQIGNFPEKIHVIRNGFDPSLYFKIENYSIKETINIGYVTRFDKDKSFIIDILHQITEYLSSYYKIRININLIGSGELKDSFVDKMKILLSDSIHSISDYGWLQGEKLVKAYMDCDIVVAPGRSAIEGMALAKPVIAVGSKNYIGLINKETWQFGVYNNFGGIGNKFEDYINGKIDNDMDYLLLNLDNMNNIGEFSYNLTQVLYNDNTIQRDLLNIYKLVLNAHNL